MAKNSQFSVVSIGRGAKPVSTKLAVSTRTGALRGIAQTRITKVSIKTITIR